MRTSTRQDWLAAGAVLAVLAAVFAIPAATTGTSLARATAAMALGSLIALVVARTPFTFALRVRTGFVLLVALALWYATTRVWAVSPAGSMFEAARVSAFVLVVWAVHTSVVGTAARRALLAGIAACALYVSFPPLLDALAHGAPSERVAGELGYWNASAAVALLLVPAAVALAGTGRRALIVVAAALIPVAGVSAAAFASRGALASLAVGLLVQALLDPDWRGGLPRAFVAAAALALTILGLALDGMPVAVALLAPALAALGGFGLIRARRVRREALATVHPLTPVPAPDDPDAVRPDPARLRRRVLQASGAVLLAVLVALLVVLVLDTSDSDLPSPTTKPPAADARDVTRLTSTDDSSRLDWYRKGVEMWKERPVTGQGGGAFGVLYVERWGADIGHVHSMPLEVLIETGLIGIGLLAAGSVLLLRVLRQGRRSTDRALAGAISALLLVQATIDWTLSLPQLVLLLAIAGPIALVSPPEPAPAAARVPVRSALTMLGALAVATTVAFVPMLASLLADQGAHRLDEGEPVRAAKLFDQSMQLVPSLETLHLQVLALQMAGRDDEARRLLRTHEQVWFTSNDGLQLAQPLLADDPDYGPRIEDALARIDDPNAPAD